MYYSINQSSLSAGAVNISQKLENVKFSHLSIQLHGTAIKATEAPKLVLNCWTQDSGSNIRKRVTNVPLSVLGEYQDMNGGIGFISTTDLHILLDMGTIDTSDQTFWFEIKSSSNLANSAVISIFAVMLVENSPEKEYMYKAITTDGLNIVNCLSVYDIDTAYDSTVESLITFKGSQNQLTIPHKQAFSVAMASSRLETANKYGVIYSDKDYSTGRDIRIEPNTAFNAFIVQYGMRN